MKVQISDVEGEHRAEDKLGSNKFENWPNFCTSSWTFWVKKIQFIEDTTGFYECVVWWTIRYKGGNWSRWSSFFFATRFCSQNIPGVRVLERSPKLAMDMYIYIYTCKFESVIQGMNIYICKLNIEYVYVNYTHIYIYEPYYDISIFKYMYICVRDTPSLSIVTSKHTWQNHSSQPFRRFGDSESCGCVKAFGEATMYWGWQGINKWRAVSKLFEHFSIEPQACCPMKYCTL